MHSRRLIICVVKKAQRKDQREHKLREIVRDVSLEMLKKISLCLASFTPRFEIYVGRTLPSKAFTQHTHKEWMKKGTYA